MEGHRWTGSGSPAVTGHGLRGAVVGYLPVLVVDEEQMKRGPRSQSDGTDEESGSGQDSWRG